jgi:hypothetical protein
LEKKNMKATRILVTVVCGLTLSALALAGVPDDKKTLKLDNLPGKKGAVTFEHEKHASEHKGPGGKPITCKQCHHTEKTDTPADPKAVKGCSGCHLVTGEPKDVDGKKAPLMGKKNDKGDDFIPTSVIFHKVCGDCHKKMKAEGKKIDGCNTCHKK